ncbi:MAG: aminodeoxychorismate synthase component I [Bacteroidota bacterium]
MLAKNDAVALLNELGAKHQPFSFYCDFLGTNWSIASCNEEAQHSPFKLEIAKSYPQQDWQKADQHLKDENAQNIHFKKNPVNFQAFEEQFQYVKDQINFGNSFLTNLTFETPISSPYSLEEIFDLTNAKYKLLVPKKFVVFSPETFVKIEQDQIFSYPMKGTLDASVQDAEALLLGDKKEMAEHVTIVDLIRNDLSQIARDVQVTKFRYIERIKTNTKDLLQVSSKIQGKLGENWKANIGSILAKLLPAGSISGAPKPETVRIIKKAETYDRHFFTGICGHFDGDSLNSGVMIRFIKQQNDNLIYCSGGGITSHSKPEKEYQEMIDKVYLPI